MLSRKGKKNFTAKIQEPRKPGDKMRTPLSEIQSNSYCKIISSLQIDLNEARILKDQKQIEIELQKKEIIRLKEEISALKSSLKPVFISVGAL